MKSVKLSSFNKKKILTCYANHHTSRRKFICLSINIGTERFLYFCGVIVIFLSIISVRDDVPLVARGFRKVCGLHCYMTTGALLSSYLHLIHFLVSNILCVGHKNIFLYEMRVQTFNHAIRYV